MNPVNSDVSSKDQIKSFVIFLDSELQSKKLLYLLLAFNFKLKSPNSVAAIAVRATELSSGRSFMSSLYGKT